MDIKMLGREAGKKQMIMAILNSMSIPERKEFLNEIYGIYVDTDSIKIYKQCEELRDRINIVDNATEKTFKKTYSSIKDLHIELGAIKQDLDIETARINAQAETIEKLCKIIKFILPRVNANPFGKEYEDIKKTLEEIYKEF